MMNNKLLASLLIIFICPAIMATAAYRSPVKSSTEIDYGANAMHIAHITSDKLIVVSGSTYSYTVDSARDEGLVSTATKVQHLLTEITSKDGSIQQYTITDKQGKIKPGGIIATGDHLMVTSENGKSNKTYQIVVQPMALAGNLQIQRNEVTINTKHDLVMYFTAGQRSPDATVSIRIPAGIDVTMNNTTVNVIGRGDVKLKDLDKQSIGRVGGNYSYSNVGTVDIGREGDGSSTLTFNHLDLRPANGADLKVTISGVKLSQVKNYIFKATYTTSKPEVLVSAGTGGEIALLTAVRSISDFARILDKGMQYRETPDIYTTINFTWTPAQDASKIQLMYSLDKGKNWNHSNVNINPADGTASLSELKPNQLYQFKIMARGGANKGSSNIVKYYSGKFDIKEFGVTGIDDQDNTESINDAIEYLSHLGGGTLLFSEGIYNVRTVHLKSNVWLYLDGGATIKALKGADAPEPTWFSDTNYRSGLSPTSRGPYINPENWLTKQDVGHTYFHNTMFFGERLDNVKIIGTGRITGNGHLVTSDKVMNRDPDNRADKMFTFKLCSNIEIGGLYRDADLWYDPDTDEPYYIDETGSKISDISNMLNIDQGGHFVLLATGTDNINIHNTYLGKNKGSNARDIYDFMACNNVTVTNIYSRVSSDDVVKLGSDCSLGFTRPVSHYMVRNIIGDTNCNLFQIGSETADDIMNVHVDNIYVLGANKAGFSISTNDGAHVKDIHLNCGHTGKLHSRSKMFRTRVPFFISISNRGRVLGANVGRYKFDENGVKHDELLNTNINIGQVENIILKGIDIQEVYGGSSYHDRDQRWGAYDGTQNKATTVVAGYKLPDPEEVEGDLDFRLPNGKHTGYVENIEFKDIHILVKGGNPLSDTIKAPPELGVGQYNVSNLKVQPAYGIWARHAKQLVIKESTFNYEKRDSRYAIFLDDVKGAQISDIKAVLAKDNDHVIRLKNASDVIIENVTYYNDEWKNSPKIIEHSNYTTNKEVVSIPNK